MDNEFKNFMDFMNVKLIPEQEHAIYDVLKNVIIVDKNDEIKTQTKRRKITKIIKICLKEKYL
jgi:hypothetical protein